MDEYVRLKKCIKSYYGSSKNLKKIEKIFFKLYNDEHCNKKEEIKQLKWLVKRFLNTDNKKRKIQLLNYIRELITDVSLLYLKTKHQVYVSDFKTHIFTKEFIEFYCTI